MKRKTPWGYNDLTAEEKERYRTLPKPIGISEADWDNWSFRLGYFIAKLQEELGVNI